MYKDKIKRGNKNKGYYYYRKKENIYLHSEVKRTRKLQKR